MTLHYRLPVKFRLIAALLGVGIGGVGAITLAAMSVATEPVRQAVFGVIGVLLGGFYLSIALTGRVRAGVWEFARKPEWIRVARNNARAQGQLIE